MVQTVVKTAVVWAVGGGVGGGGVGHDGGVMDERSGGGEDGRVSTEDGGVSLTLLTAPQAIAKSIAYPRLIKVSPVLT